MSLRDELGKVIARDARYTIESYAFVLESLKLARHHKLKARSRRRGDPRATGSKRKPPGMQPAESSSEPRPGHVTGRELCLAARRLALRYYGLMALTVLERWGIRSTSDIGEIVYHMIESGDLDKTPTDRRSDFDNVFDFTTALRPRSLLDEDQKL